MKKKIISYDLGVAKDFSNQEKIDKLGLCQKFLFVKK